MNRIKNIIAMYFKNWKYKTAPAPYGERSLFLVSDFLEKQPVRVEQTDIFL